MRKLKIAVVIPAFKCRSQILGVLNKIPDLVDLVIVVDDCCPENVGHFVLSRVTNPRVMVHRHTSNQGVGGAMATGYSLALKNQCDIVVKVDGDGQMDPQLIPDFLGPIEQELADYVKGNRFSQVEHMRGMPLLRLIGNLGLSFINKASSGYWRVLDPTNGFTAIHRSALEKLPFQKISKRFFFESDMLFRLNLIDALVIDLPMSSSYGDEVSNLKIRRALLEFSHLNLKNFYKRMIYRYFVLDFNMASVELLFSGIFLVFGILFGAYHWGISFHLDRPTPTGTIMIAALSMTFGFQLLLSFIGYDISRNPNIPLCKLTKRSRDTTKNNSDRTEALRPLEPLKRDENE